MDAAQIALLLTTASNENNGQHVQKDMCRQGACWPSAKEALRRGHSAKACAAVACGMHKSSNIDVVHTITSRRTAERELRIGGFPPELAEHRTRTHGPPRHVHSPRHSVSVLQTSSATKDGTNNNLDWSHCRHRWGDATGSCAAKHSVSLPRQALQSARTPHHEGDHTAGAAIIP